LPALRFSRDEARDLRAQGLTYEEIGERLGVTGTAVWYAIGVKGTRCAQSTRPEGVAKRFWSRVEKTEGCWLWTGYCEAAGYGTLEISVKGKRRKAYAHRLAYELTYGAIPAGLFICHHCDNPPCCNPDHLFVGTAGENSRDCVQKGRHFTPFRKVSA
jgi:hypothetical protein